MMCGMGYLMFTSFYMKQWGMKSYLKKIGLEKDRRKVDRVDFFKQV